MWYTHRVFQDAISEDLSGHLLLFWKSGVETVDQDVRINESGHACTGPPCASLCLVDASAGVPSYVA